MKFPFVLRKMLNKKIQKIEESHRKEKQRLRHEFEADLAFQKKDLKDVVSRLTEISIVHGPKSYGRQWRVVVEMDADMMVQALERGNDNRLIEYIADIAKYKIIDNLHSCNIQRPESVRMGRG